MKALKLHPWDISPQEGIKIQNMLRKKVIVKKGILQVRTVAGVDISIRGKDMIGAVVVLSFPKLEIIETQTANKKLDFDYIPGLLSFRESPSAICALEMVKTQIDLILVDGQGIAHPRRFGIASHLGLLFDIPTIGCAKTRLCGVHSEPAPRRGAYTFLYDKDETIGAVLRTKEGTSPLYISIGHKIDLLTAIQYTLACCKGYRLPEPTRLADGLAGGTLDGKSLQPKQLQLNL
jgi:deoxyribonuclease V